MAYFLINHKIIYEQNGTTASILKEDGLPDTVDTGKEAFIAVVDVEPKVISAPEDRPELKDAEINKHFSADYIIQDERIERNLFQVVGIKKDVLEEIYGTFSKQNVQILVPYALSIRAFLNSHQITLTNNCILFVDDYEDGVFLTSFDSLRFSKTRRINKAEPEEILKEIERSKKNYTQSFISEHGKEPVYIHISNNSEIIKALDNIKVNETEDNVYIHSKIPAIDGLKSAKFNMHFLLPEQVLKNKKLKRLKTNFVTLFISVSLIAAGGLFYGYTLFYKNLQSNKAQQLLSESIRLKNNLIETNKQTFQAQLKKTSLPQLSLINYHFFINLPNGYEIQNYGIKQIDPHTWIFEALIFITDPNEKIVAFNNFGVFKDRIIEYTTVNNKPGQHINLNLRT